MTNQAYLTGINTNLKIDRSVCFVLDQNIKEGYRIQNDGKKYGFDIDLFIMGDGSHNLEYDYIDSNELPPDYGLKYPKWVTWNKTPNLYNHWKCQKYVIEKAYSDGCSNLMIFEDDSIFMPNFQEVFDKVSKYFINHKWDSIYFGNFSYNFDKNEKVDKYIYRARSNVGGFHGVLINKTLLKIAKDFKPMYIMDDMFRVFINKNVFRILPSIIGQKSGYSASCGKIYTPGEQQRV